MQCVAAAGRRRELTRSPLLSSPPPATFRSLKADLAAAFSEAIVAQYEGLIADIIQRFVDGDEDPALPPPVEASPQQPGASKRSLEGAVEEATPAKQAKTAGDGGAGVPGLNLGGNKWAGPEMWKGNNYFKLREYYTDKEGELKPTKRGINLNAAQFGILKEKVAEISEAMAAGNEDYMVQLPGERRITVSKYGGKLRVDVREWYEKDPGEWKPGRKGCSLLPAEWEVLAPYVKGFSMAGEMKSPVKSEVKSPVTSPAKEYSDDSVYSLALSADRLLKVKDFKGLKVDIRGYYKADDGLRPTKKGILLTQDQWKVLSQNVAGISAAVEQETEKFELPLGVKKDGTPSLRRVTTKKYKGQFLIDVREWYERDGEVKPGFKGVSLKPEQWKTLAAAAADVTSKLS